MRQVQQLVGRAAHRQLTSVRDGTYLCDPCWQERLTEAQDEPTTVVVGAADEPSRGGVSTGLVSRLRLDVSRAPKALLPHARPRGIP